MAKNNPLSASCQIIANAVGSDPIKGTTGDESAWSAEQSNETNAHYVIGTGSLGRLQYQQNQKQYIDGNRDSSYAKLSQSAHLMQRVKSERVLNTKSPDDRRQRTIIIEKRNDSFGFTLQSYGIHYRNDQEVEMITYVDYVEYAGPAFIAGMKEGDVILSVNGEDMQKADHKTLLQHIKRSPNHIRLVVMFEDCVHKVELHMRYLQLQNLLKSKLNELDRIRLHEHNILQGKWKTHSLPVRKRNGNTRAEDSITNAEKSPINSPQVEGQKLLTRSTVSTEGINSISLEAQRTNSGLMSFEYLQPAYNYSMQLSNSMPNSDEYYLSIGETLTAPATASGTPTSAKRSGERISTAHRICDKHKARGNTPTQQRGRTKSHSKSNSKERIPKAKYCQGNSCNPCIDFKWISTEKPAIANPNDDNISLEAYDLATPCCDTQCLPYRRRLYQAHKDAHAHKLKHRERERKQAHDGGDQQPARCKSQGPIMSNVPKHSHHYSHQRITPELGRQYATPHRDYCYISQQQQQQQQQQSYQHQLHQHALAKARNGDSQVSSLQSRYIDLPSDLASHCSLHLSTSSEFQTLDSSSHSTSFSTDTLFWDTKSDNHSSPQSQFCKKQKQQQQQQQQQQQHYHHHQYVQNRYQQQEQQYVKKNMCQYRYHATPTHAARPAEAYCNVGTYGHKPKSWDNLTSAALSGYTYDYLDIAALEANPKLANNLRVVPPYIMRRKSPFGRHSTYVEAEYYQPTPATNANSTTAKLAANQQADQQHFSHLQSSHKHPAYNLGYYSLLPNEPKMHSTSLQPAVKQNAQAKTSETTRL